MYREITSNKRRSAVVVGLFVLAWLVVGGVLGFLVAEFTHHSANGLEGAQSVSEIWTAILVGVVAGSIVALLGILYSVIAGTRLVLQTAGAVRADSAEYQQLNDLVNALAIGEGIRPPTVYVIKDPSPNAFATGISPDKAAITVTSGLLAIMNREELEGVIGHEMSHIKNHDIRLLLIVGTLIGLAALLARFLANRLLGEHYGGEDNGGGQL